MPTFSERLAAVIGDEAPHGWAKRHGLSPTKIWDWLKNDRTPRTPQVEHLATVTSIPSSWWLHGELPPPAPASRQGAQSPAPERLAYYLPAGMLEAGLRAADAPGLPPLEVRREQGRINVPALAAIIEGAMRAAPHATIPDLAAHCARVYAMAIEQGLITADGTGPGITKAA